jgi:hypothetical protein
MDRQVACMGEIRKEYNIFVRKLEGRRLLGRQSIDRKIMLKWILGK